MRYVTVRIFPSVRHIVLKLPAIKTVDFHAIAVQGFHVFHTTRP